MTRRHPVADIRAGVERIRQVQRTGSTGLEHHRDVAAHRRRRHHQMFDGWVGLC
jgi:hypothetical protein